MPGIYSTLHAGMSRSSTGVHSC